MLQLIQPVAVIVKNIGGYKYEKIKIKTGTKTTDIRYKKFDLL